MLAYHEYNMYKAVDTSVTTFELDFYSFLERKKEREIGMSGLTRNDAVVFL